MSSRWPNLNAKANARRAAARKRYLDGLRAVIAERRRIVAQVYRDAVSSGGIRRGIWTALARQLRVHKSVICRDLAAVIAESREPLARQA